MLKIAFFLLGVSVCAFAWIMLREPRTLWSGASLLGVLLCWAVAMFLLLSEYADRLAEHDLLMNLLVALFLLTAGCALAFPAVLIGTLFIEGVKVIRHEGLRPANLLTVLFSVLLFLYLAVWPVIGGLEKGKLGTRLYVSVSLSAVYALALMAVYLLSAALNLFHWKKRRDADYIIVLGAGLMGTRVTPLLAARIDKGIELLRYNPDAKLLLAKQQGLECVGFGARTKWYFTLNALLREFVGYLSLTWKKQILALVFVIMIAVIITI